MGDAAIHALDHPAPPRANVGRGPIDRHPMPQLTIPSSLPSSMPIRSGVPGGGYQVGLQVARVGADALVAEHDAAARNAALLALVMGCPACHPSQKPQ